MTLAISLQNAVSGLQAAQAQISLISGNIANAQTPGYSRQVIPTTSQIAGAREGAGVNLGVPTRLVDQALNRNISAQVGIESAATTRDTYFQQIGSLLGTVDGGDTLGDSLSKFSNALQAVATTPEDSAAQATTIAAAQQLVQQINTIGNGIQSIRINADIDINSAVTQLNASLQQVASLNNDISRAQALGESTAGLADQRDLAINQVAKLINIQSFARSDGTVVVMTGGGKLLADNQAQTVNFSPSLQLNATAAVSGLSVNGVNIGSDITSGRIGALLKVRDTDLPNLTQELNQFTIQLFDTTSTPNLATTNTGAIPSITDATHFFSGVDVNPPTPPLTPPATQDNSITLVVHPDLIANPSLLGPQSTAAADLSTSLLTPRTFNAAGALVSPITGTLNDYANQILAQNANTAAQAASDTKFQTSVLSNLNQSASQVSGVNIDEELANLSSVQNAYAASARVVSAVQEMFDSLFAIRT